MFFENESSKNDIENIGKHFPETTAKYTKTNMLDVINTGNHVITKTQTLINTLQSKEEAIQKQSEIFNYTISLITPTINLDQFNFQDYSYILNEEELYRFMIDGFSLFIYYTKIDKYNEDRI